MNTFHRSILSLAILLTTLIAHADVDTSVTIGIAIPPQSEQISDKALNLAETRLSGILANHGIASDLCGDFVMCPRFIVTSCEVAEGGMKNLYRVDLGMTLFVTQMSTRSSYGSIEKSFRGTGFSRDEAIFDAIKKINASDPSFASLISSSKQKIEDYYSSNLVNMLNRAKTMSKSQNYDEALNLLFTYPSNLEGSERAMALAQEIYLAKIDEDVAATLLEARSLAANGNYDSALSTLATVNPSSSHYPKANALAKEIAKNIADREEADRAFERLQSAREHTREMASIKAARDAAVEWAKAQKHDYYISVNYLW